MNLDILRASFATGRFVREFHLHLMHLLKGDVHISWEVPPPDDAIDNAEIHHIIMGLLHNVCEYTALSLLEENETIEMFGMKCSFKKESAFDDCPLMGRTESYEFQTGLFDEKLVQVASHAESSRGELCAVYEATFKISSVPLIDEALRITRGEE